MINIKQQKNRKAESSSFDKEFFTNLQPKGLTKGGIVGYHKYNNIVKKGADLNSSLDSQLDNKPWKKHFKKKEGHGKLRRVTSHFDKIDLFWNFKNHQ